MYDVSLYFGTVIEIRIKMLSSTTAYKLDIFVLVGAKLASMTMFDISLCCGKTFRNKMQSAYVLVSICACLLIPHCLP